MDSTLTTPEEPTRNVPFPDPVTAPLPAAAPAAPSAQHCGNCAALLAADQRYCMECGERHGDARLPVMSGRPDLAAPAAAPAPRGPRGPRASANTGLIAGVGTLLVALGVGVLIGRSSESDPPARNAGVQVVTVAGAGGAVASGASSTAPASTAAAAAGGDAAAKGKDDKKSGGDAKAKSADASTPKSGGVVAKKPGKVVKIGSKGSGKGYKNGKFTGDFFGQ